MSSKEMTAQWEKGSIYSDPREEYSKVEANTGMEIEEDRSGCFNYCGFSTLETKKVEARNEMVRWLIDAPLCNGHA